MHYKMKTHKIHKRIYTQ